MQNTFTYTANLAKQAGEVLLGHFKLGGIASNLKADRTVVTEADLAADKLITNSLRAAYPEDTVLSEESNTAPEEISANTWVIDPLDGTANFSLGMHVWGVSIARIVDGKPDCAALYFPILDELYTAQRGQGAFLNGDPIQAKPPVKGQPTALFACCSRAHRRYNVTIPYKTRILGSAAYDFCLVARGAAALGLQVTPKIWDLAAGWLVLQEAGGDVSTLNGSKPFPLQPGTDYNNISFPTLMAPNAEMAEKARQQIKPNTR